jgi:hypothetical protein
VWLQPLAQQYHTALDLGQPHQAIRLLGSLLDVNDKSVDRRLPDANLQAHLTRRSHVPEIGEVVVVPKDHRRQRHTVTAVHADGTVDLELLVDVVEVLPGQPAGAQVPEPPVVSRDIARSSIVCSNDIIVNAYRLQQARAHNLQNGPGLAGAPKPKSTRSYVSLVAFVYLLQFTTSPTAIRYLSGNTQKTAKRTALRATLYTTYVLWCQRGGGSGGGGGGGGGGGRGADEGLLGVVLCRIKAHWVVKGDDGVEARFLWKDLVLSKEDPLFSLVPHAGRKKASTGE